MFATICGCAGVTSLLHTKLATPHTASILAARLGYIMLGIGFVAARCRLYVQNNDKSNRFSWWNKN